MRIGELSRRTGVSVRALRYYEEQGLLVPGRDRSGYRDYGPAAVAKVGQIQLLYAAGLCSNKIAQLLPTVCGDATSVLVPAELAEELDEVRERLLREIDERVASLRLLERAISAAQDGPEPVERPSYVRRGYLVQPKR